MVKNWVRYDEYEDVLTSTDLLALVAPKLRKQTSSWKWMILAAHNGLQGALVCAVKDTSNTNVLENGSAAKMLNYLKTLEGERPLARLTDFATLLKRYRKKYPSNDITTEQLKLIQKLHKQFRNNFAHFVPTGWLIEVALLPPIIESAVKLIESAMQQPQVLIHLSDNQNRRLAKNISAIRTVLTFLS
jgi:hypothetical protein